MYGYFESNNCMRTTTGCKAVFIGFGVVTGASAL